MFVLTFKKNQSIQIIVPPSTEPQIITVAYKTYHEGKVKIGFKAPKDIKITTPTKPIDLES